MFHSWRVAVLSDLWGFSTGTKGLTPRLTRASAEPVPLPLVFKPGKTLGEPYGYAPEYPLAEPGFDSANRPYIRASSFVATLENGHWEKRDFVSFIRAAYPDFKRTYTHGDVESRLNDAQIIFDVNDNACMIRAVELNNGAKKSLLLFSRDYCKTWSVYELPGVGGDYNSHAYEHHHSWHNTLQGPPVILRAIRRSSFPSGWHNYYYRWNQAYYDIYLVQPRIEDGKLVMPKDSEMVKVTDSCIGFDGVHSGGASFCVTRNGKTRIVWAGVKPPANPPHIEPGDNATPVYIATYDHQTKTVGPTKYLFSTESCDGVSDVHNMPGICMDSEGYLHVIAAGHNRPCIYVRSLKPNGAYSGWTAPVETQRGATHSYLGFVCDRDDTLHIVYRRYYTDSHHSGKTYHGLGYQRKRKNESSWEPDKQLIVPAYAGYAG